MFKQALLILFLFKMISNERILFVNPFKTYSHYKSLHKIALKLAEKGHNVTIITAIDINDSHKNLNKIYVNSSVKYSGVISDLLKTNHHDGIFVTFLEIIKSFFAHSVVQNFLTSKETYDMVVINEVVSTPVYGFCVKFKGICVSSTALHSEIIWNLLTGYPRSFLIPPVSGWEQNYPSSFYERIQIVLKHFYYIYKKKFVLFPKWEEISNEHFGFSVGSTLRNIDFIFENSNVHFNYPGPIHRSMVQIGGFHVENRKKLPQDMQEFMDNSSGGVIFMSMGSIFDIPQDLLTVFLNAFAANKMNVLWKTNLSNVSAPQNVMMVKWAPQAEILDHSNTKIFITHCGVLSTYEAIMFEVPTIAIPLVWDQVENAKLLKDRISARILDYKNVSEKMLLEAFHELLNNKSYKERAVEYSKLFSSAPIDPFEKTILMYENLLKFGKPTHLKDPSFDMEWYENYNVDVIVFMISVLFLQVYIVSKYFYKLFKFGYHCSNYFITTSASYTFKY